MKKSFLLALFLPFLACQSKQHLRTPTAETETSETEILVRQVMKGDKKAVLKLGTEIRASIQILSWAQQLTSSYDLFLNEQLKKSHSDDLSKALESEIVCKLSESYFVSENTEDEIVSIQRSILAEKQAKTYSWFISHFESSMADSPVQIMAKAQIVRTLRDRHMKICQSSECPSFPKLAGKPQVAFDPLDDKEMLEFKKKFLTKIAVYSPAEISLMKKGTCLEVSARTPNSETYDWKQRNKLGRKLNAGEFIFTYDDGPDPKQTTALVQAWDASGLAKPTMFWLAKNVERYPELSREIHINQYEIAVHSYSHPDIGNLANAINLDGLNRVNKSHFSKELKSVTPEGFTAWQEKTLDHQLVTSTQIISKILGPYSRVNKFRLPYGSGRTSPKVGARLGKLDMNHYYWDIDSLDWQDRNPLSIVERVHKQMNLLKRGIILFHDIHFQSVEASKILIEDFKNSKDKKVLRLDEVEL